MKEKTILILSDIHYGELAELENFGKSGVPSDEDLRFVANAVRDCLDTNEMHKIDYLFVLGDLTSRGSPGEFQDFYRFLTILKNMLGLNDDEVYLTYGNHDVDWSICKITNKPKEHHEAYCVAAANIGGFFAPSGSFKYEGPVIGCGVAHLDGIDLISLNSGIECYDDQAVRHGRLGEKQYQWLTNLQPKLRENTVRIVIIHHHLLTLPYPSPLKDFSALEEGANVLDILGQCGINIVLHGHRHHPIINTQSHSGWQNPITFLCAGSFGVNASHRASGRLPNMFHVASISSAPTTPVLEGTIKTFELDLSYEWVPLVSKPGEFLLNQTHWFGEPKATENAPSYVQTIIKNLLSNELLKEDHVKLPKYDTLPLSLRCILHSELNELFQSEAAQKGLSITGNYPRDCMVSKV